MNTALMPEMHRKSHLVLDDVYSFVLRLHLNPAPGGQGLPRPQFNLKNVNKGTNRRMQNLEEVLQELRTQIELILQSSDRDMN
jgi:hypothetical protein